MKEYKPSIYCPRDCPFLSIYDNGGDKIAYHCDLFDSYLAFDGDIIKCSECLAEVQHEDKKEMSKQEKEFRILLDLKSEQFSGLLGREDKNLISNLYQVLDETEKQIMKSILNNDNMLDVFVKSLQAKPKDDSFLQNVRKEMDNIVLQEEKRQKEQQNFLSLQQQIRRRQMGR